MLMGRHLAWKARTAFRTPRHAGSTTIDAGSRSRRPSRCAIARNSAPSTKGSRIAPTAMTISAVPIVTQTRTIPFRKRSHILVMKDSFMGVSGSGLDRSGLSRGTGRLAGGRLFLHIEDDVVGG